MYDVIIVGAGPAGLFSAYELITKNKDLKVMILDKGRFAKNRVCPMNKNKGECVNCKPCAILSGYGGAGTFSDGKLNTGLNDPKIRFVLKTFVEYGANQNVYYDAKPHVGTDKLRDVVKGLREKIISLGGEIHFDSLVTKIDEDTIEVKNLVEDSLTLYKSSHIILAIGHSAKDTYEMLYKAGFNLEPKAFSMGVRIEHLQSKINKMQYGSLDYSYAAPYKAAASSSSSPSTV